MTGQENIFQKKMNEGHSNAWDQNWKQAAEAYRQALLEFPDNPKALNNYALALYQLQNYTEALNAYIHAGRVSPEEPIPFEKIAEINERLGNISQAIRSALYAAELYLKLRDLDKAISNWLTVIQLDPDNLQARTRLALIHEKTGQTSQAVIDYITIASILQNSGNPTKALEVLDKALKLDPKNEDLLAALTVMHTGKILPRPVRPKGGTGALRKAAVKELAPPEEKISTGPDPIVEARQKALNVFADLLFDMAEEDSLTPAGKISGLEQRQPAISGVILPHLSLAIDAQTRNQDKTAIAALEKALKAGFTHQAVYFDLGLLYFSENQLESALPHLQNCIKHNDYALSAHLIRGKILFSADRLPEAATEYMQALKIADGACAPATLTDSLLQLYEPLLESISHEKNPDSLKKVCTNVEEMLVRPNWQHHLQKLRADLPAGTDRITPIAEIILQAQSSDVIEAMKSINELARANNLRSAMDEAFNTVLKAPSYLPLHILIGDLLIQEDRQADAITKFNIVAHSYSVRGEPQQAAAILRRIIQIAPMDLTSRQKLIDQLLAQGLVEPAILEYMDMADIYYRLAELDQARTTYTTALRLIHQPGVNQEWNIKILQRMADIDMQRLDWRQAIRVFEQIRTLAPGDYATRENLIDLHLRLSQSDEAQTELESFIAFLENSQPGQILPSLKKLQQAMPEQILVQRSIADYLFKTGKKDEAIQILENIGNKLIDSGEKEILVSVINQILLMNPPDSDDYRKILARL